MSTTSQMAERFRGYLPVVIDIETGGFDASRDAILELAGILLEFDGDQLFPGKKLHYHVEPSPGLNIEPASLSFTGINPDDPARGAVSELDAFKDFFAEVRRALKSAHCNRAVIVAHNATFDHQFVRSASERNNLKRNPFHPFTSLDTASIAAVAYGQTVLSRACAQAGVPFDESQAHSALYDAERAALLFCEIVNRWTRMGGWPPEGAMASGPPPLE